MRNLLRPSAQRQLLDFLDTDPLLVFDYDGTLSPIVIHADQAVIRKSTRTLLKRLCEHWVCALLSGRARKDVAARVEGIPFVQVVGSHGADWARPRPGNAQRRKRIAAWYRQLEGSLVDVPGVSLENKGLSLSVHYRHAPNRHVAARRIERELASLKGLRVIGGKAVFNLLPRSCGGKGWALRQLKKQYCKSTALYVGDDTTDEDVFSLPEQERVFKIRVGYCADSRAEFYIPCQPDIDRVLELIDGKRMSLEDAA